MIQKSFSNQRSTLYLVATPIGNLDEFTLRGQKILKAVSVIFCEDTRVSKNLLNAFNIKNKLISLHEHNEKERTLTILKYLENNEDVALISDAGYPLMSDPGYYVVANVITANYNVVSISGANAFLNALVCSGLKPYPFTFYGFLAHKELKIIEELKGLRYRSETLVFYISIHRLQKTLVIIKNIFGNRRICLARELTKVYETFYRGSLDEVLKLDFETLKGECVLIVSGYVEVAINYSDLSIKEHVRMVAKEQDISIKEAIKEVANIRDLSKNIVYQIYHSETE